MSQITESSLRRRQVIAERTVEKVRRETIVYMEDDATLWWHICEALERDIKTRIYLGHVDRVGFATHALLAARELKLRGTQLQLSPA